MRSADCSHEGEVFEAVSTGAWPDACEPSLRAHLENCRNCSEIVLVAGALIADRDSAMRVDVVPSSGVVWWRMQLRRRHEAARSARRVVLTVQAAVFASVLGIALVVLAPRLWDKLAPLTAFTTSSIVMTAIQWATPLLLALVVWLTLTPVAVWLALSKE